MSTKWPQGEITPNIPASVLGGNNISGVYTLDQLNRLNADFGPQMQRSLRFRGSASAYLNRTPSVAGNRTTWTWSGWVKIGNLTATNGLMQCGPDGSNQFRLLIDSSGPIYIYDMVGGSYITNLGTTQVFRDPSAWYHFVLVYDTTQATASNRVRFYVNGIQVTAFSGATYPSQNYASGNVNSVASTKIGRGDQSSTFYFDGYMAEVNFIDGQALTPSSFGKYNATTGVWQPIFYAGTYGTNGFRLTFANNASTTTLGYDTSGNGNNWTTNNFSLTAGSTYDSMLDVPTNWVAGDPVQARGNYAVWNAISNTGSATTNAGNLGNSFGSSSGDTVISSIALNGKFYSEFYITSLGSAVRSAGVAESGASANNIFYYSDGRLYVNNSLQGTYATYTTGDIVAIDCDTSTRQARVYKNNTQIGSTGTVSGTGNLFFTASGSGAGSGSSTGGANFGQRPFSYTPPTGYKSLCTQNLPAPTIYNGAQYMAATTYTGTGSSLSISNSVNSASFQPDLVWIKRRSDITNHVLYDSVRGSGSGKALSSNLTNAEGLGPSDNDSLYGYVSSFNSNGFGVAAGSSGSQYVNTNAATYVGWQWKANGAAVSNTSGTITSSVSANTTAGFSVVTYTGNGTNPGATIGHGLGVTPSMIITKSRSTTGEWPSYHVSIGVTNTLYLNATYAASTYVNRFSAVSSTTFTTGSSGSELNANGTTYVAYCFAAIAGYSAFGSYTGNGSSDGPFVYCGFRPRWLLVKSSDISGASWILVDTSISPYNVTQNILYPNYSDPQVTGSIYQYDILSNGFKVRATGGSWNASGGTYIYACFAENPFQNSLAR